MPLRGLPFGVRLNARLGLINATTRFDFAICRRRSIERGADIGPARRCELPLLFLKFA
jgi:hypothetical protein